MKSYSGNRKLQGTLNVLSKLQEQGLREPVGRSRSLLRQLFREDGKPTLMVKERSPRNEYNAVIGAFTARLTIIITNKTKFSSTSHKDSFSN
jgi:hypothetical protein